MKRILTGGILFLTVLMAGVSCSGETQPWSDLPERLAAGIVVYGDSRSNPSDHRRIVEGIAQVRPQAVFHSGDLVANGTRPADWESFHAITGSLLDETDFYPAVGNHEEPDDPDTLYFDQFELPGNERWYSVSVDDIVFVILDTVALDDFTDPASPQFRWLRIQLASAGADRTVIAVFHHPPYSTGSHGSTTELHTHLVPLFEEYDVDAVFTGHDHDYERSEAGGIPYIVTGGGGAPLRDQEGTAAESVVFVKANHFCVIYRDGGRLMVEAWSSDVELIDRFEIAVP